MRRQRSKEIQDQGKGKCLLRFPIHHHNDDSSNHHSDGCLRVRQEDLQELEVAKNIIEVYHENFRMDQIQD